MSRDYRLLYACVLLSLYYTHITKGEVSIRLAGGSTVAEGRVEILHGGEWGTVCDDYWDHRDAKVVCRQLGYQYAMPTGGGEFGQGTGQIWLDDVDCEGSEDTLDSCRHLGWGVEYCSHWEDAGVRCTSKELRVRLADGGTPNKGRVEIYYDGHWGTVCHEGWNNTDAAVVCRQLGYLMGVAYHNAAFGEGTGPIVLDHVNCQVGMSSLVECEHSGWGVHRPSCTHQHDAGVMCFYPSGQGVGELRKGTLPLVQTSPSSSQVPALRLVGGNTARAGMVQLLHEGQWGAICGDGWDKFDARVVCKQLGYATGTSHNWAHPEGIPVWATRSQCGGMETNLMACLYSHIPLGNTLVCPSAYQFAGVVCEEDTKKGEEVEDLQVRLVNGSSPKSGRVEVYHDSHWGTVCYIDDVDAHLICQHLGYAEGMATSSLTYGQGSGPIWLNIKCSATHHKFTDCINPWKSDKEKTFTPVMGDTGCQHSLDGGVVCFTTEKVDLPVRLVDGDNEMSGRVQVQVDGRWGSICSTGWDNQDATVVCRQLGYVNGAVIDQTTPRWLRNVQCIGTETGLRQCVHGTRGASCDLEKDAMVTCSGECFPGTFGPECTYKCNCLDSAEACDRRTGDCPVSGCQYGFGTDPDWYSNPHGYNCLKGCESRRFGSGCLEECHCLASDSCNSIKGACPDDMCDYGYKTADLTVGHGYHCNARCEGQKREFGANCEMRCHCENDSQCTPDKGRCPNDKCDLGYYTTHNPHGYFCQEECRDGMYGVNCQQSCHCLGVWPSGRHCLPADGACHDDVCDYGYITVKNTDNYQCSEICPEGYFGLGCEKKCHCLVKDATCSADLGSCPFGQCDLGYQDDPEDIHHYHCQKECDDGRFGGDCIGHCHCSEACEKTSGICPGTCLDGWTGPDCQIYMTYTTYVPEDIETTEGTTGVTNATESDMTTTEERSTEPTTEEAKTKEATTETTTEEATTETTTEEATTETTIEETTTVESTTETTEGATTEATTETTTEGATELTTSDAITTEEATTTQQMRTSIQIDVTNATDGNMTNETIGENSTYVSTTATEPSDNITNVANGDVEYNDVTNGSQSTQSESGTPVVTDASTQNDTDLVLGIVSDEVTEDNEENEMGTTWPKARRDIPNENQKLGETGPVESDCRCHCAALGINVLTLLIIINAVLILIIIIFIIRVCCKNRSSWQAVDKQDPDEAFYLESMNIFKRFKTGTV